MTWDSEVLGLLADTQEVEVETIRPDGNLRRTVIWIVVDGEEVFVRSVRGDRGKWWQAAVDRPDEVALLVDGRRLEVKVTSAADDEWVVRYSGALKRKYAGDPSLPSMLREHTLDTTLRLEPR